LVKLIKINLIILIIYIYIHITNIITMPNYYEKYVKYKTKYLNLKKKSMQIKIDDYIFELIGKTKHNGRDLVKIKSMEIQNPEKTYEFYCYNSNSQLNFFRLAYFKRPVNVFIKGDTSSSGYDYAQNTLIHLSLTKFIYSKFDQLNTINLDFNEMEDVNVLNHINNNNRAKIAEPFSKVKILCGKTEITNTNTDTNTNTNTDTENTTILYEDILNALKNISNEIELNYNLKNDKFLYEYNRQTYNNQNKIHDYYSYSVRSVELHNKYNDTTILILPPMYLHEHEGLSTSIQKVYISLQF